MGAPADARALEPCIRPARPAVEQTLAALDRGPIGFPLARRTESVTVPIRLPRSAAQGRDGRWFVVRLHVSLVVSAASGDGFADVSALLNGRSAMLVELETRREAAGPPGLAWSTAGLIDGRRDGRGAAGRPVLLRYANYAQLRSVHGGRNRMTFRVEQYGGIRLRHLTVRSDSGVLSTALAPPRLRLQASDRVRSEQLAQGRLVRLPYRLVNAGGCPARDVEVGVIAHRGDVQVVGPATRRLDTVAGAVGGSFVVRPLRNGTHRVVLGANSNANSPGVIVELPIGAARGRRSLLGGLVPASVAAALLCTALWWRGRRADGS
jgi:hypothetical protein